METIRSFEEPREVYSFDTESDVIPPENNASPEAYPGCLVEVMKLANLRVSGASEAIGSRIVASKGKMFASVCGKCAIGLIGDSGTVYGARMCPEVVSGNISLGELA